jgi:hypothetical protein
MITSIRTANSQDGKGQAGFAWAVKVANYINGSISGANVQVLRNIGGPTWQVHWVSNYESLAAFEGMMKRFEADEGYRKLLGEARDQQLFVASSVVDRLYEAIS